MSTRDVQGFALHPPGIHKPAIQAPPRQKQLDRPGVAATAGGHQCPVPVSRRPNIPLLQKYLQHVTVAATSRHVQQVSVANVGVHSPLNTQEVHNFAKQFGPHQPYAQARGRALHHGKEVEGMPANYCWNRDLLTLHFKPIRALAWTSRSP